MDLLGEGGEGLASKHTAKNLLAAAFGSIGQSDFGEARKLLERADREVKRLREEGCDDPPDKAPRCQSLQKLNPLAAWKKRQARLQLQGDDVEEVEGEEEVEYPAPPEEERKPRKMKKLLFVVALPFVGALAAPYVGDLVPDFGKAERGEFQVAYACKTCETLSTTEPEAVFLCGACGGGESEAVVAAQLTQKVLWFEKQVGWQSPQGTVTYLDEDADFEVPPLRVKGKAVLTTTRF